MMEKLLRITIEGTMGLVYETSPRTIDIVKDGSGNVYCRYRYRSYDKNNNIIKTQLNANVINDFMTELSTLTIPAFPQHNMGLDGGFTEIEIGDYAGKSHFRWWSEPPKGWEMLDDITDRIISYCDIKEPKQV